MKTTKWDDWCNANGGKTNILFNNAMCGRGGYTKVVIWMLAVSLISSAVVIRLSVSNTAVDGLVLWLGDGSVVMIAPFGGLNI